MSDDPDRTVKETLTAAAERVKAGRPPAVAVAEAAQQCFGYTTAPTTSSTRHSAHYCVG